MDYFVNYYIYILVWLIYEQVCIASCDCCRPDIGEVSIMIECLFSGVLLSCVYFIFVVNNLF